MSEQTGIDLSRFESIPRAVRLQRQAQGFRVGFVVLAVMVCVGLPCLAFRTFSRLTELQEHGIVKQASVLQSTPAHSKSAATMTVSFESDGVQIEQTRQVTPFVEHNYFNSSTVPVTIMPGRPDDWELGPINDEVISHEVGVWELSGGICVLISLGLLIGLESSIAIERRIVSRGTVAEGSIVTSRFLDSKRGTRCEYTFRTMTQTIDRKVYGTGNVEDKYPPGTPLAVFYFGDESNPQAKPYGFFQSVELVE